MSAFGTKNHKTDVLRSRCDRTEIFVAVLRPLLLSHSTLKSAAHSTSPSGSKEIVNAQPLRQLGDIISNLQRDRGAANRNGGSIPALFALRSAGLVRCGAFRECFDRRLIVFLAILTCRNFKSLAVVVLNPNAIFVDPAVSDFANAVRCHNTNIAA
jgi:hypothetical protein